MKKYIAIIGTAVVLSAVSCGKLLEVAPPNAITDEQVIDLLKNGTDAQKQTVLNGIAGPMSKYFNYWNLGGGVLDPTVYCYQGIEWARTLQGNDVVMGYDMTYSKLAGGPYYSGTGNFKNYENLDNYVHWKGYAYAINQANLLLGYMTKEEAENNKFVMDGRARGLMIRAYSYMCLMEEYCQPYLSGGKDKLGMSLYTMYDPLQEPVARSTAEVTWKFIKDDLNEAVALLKSAGIGYTISYDELEDLDLGVANYLLARACILTGDWSNAISACDEIITKGGYSLIAEANWGGHNTGADMTGANVEFLPETNAFTGLKVNPECIFGYKKGSSYNPATNNDRAGVFTMLANPFGSYGNGACARIDDRLYNKIADDDFRKDAFSTVEISDYNFKGSSLGKVPTYAALKYAATYGIKDGGEDHTLVDLVDNTEFCKFRLAEVYLMKAEAQAQSNDAAGAKTTLNTLLAARTKAGATTLTCDNYPSMAGMTALQMVQLQYRIEMWGENGREYFNNKRWGIDVDRTDSGNHTAPNMKLAAKDMVLPFPINEIENNPYYVAD